MDARVAKMIGTIIGDYKIIDYSSEKGKYLCKCQLCGEEKYLQKGRFAYEGSIRCKCTRSGVKKGDRYNYLTALERDMSKLNQGRVYWLWQCDCGNIVSLPLKVVKSGNTKSCGCLNQKLYTERIMKVNSNLEDLTGQNFGKLKVVRQATDNECTNRPKGIRYWYCLCECGNYHIVGTSDLKRGKVQSCGCLLSAGEEKIAKLLQENKISYVTQYSFPDLQHNGRFYRFDFAILDNKNNLQYLIEYDGIQHFSEKKQFGDSENFVKIQERDKIKNEYCKRNNIPLIRIPYTHLNKITIQDCLIDNNKFLL